MPYGYVFRYIYSHFRTKLDLELYFVRRYTHPIRSVCEMFISSTVAIGGQTNCLGRGKGLFGVALLL